MKVRRDRFLVLIIAASPAQRIHGSLDEASAPV